MIEHSDVSANVSVTEDVSENYWFIVKFLCKLSHPGDLLRWVGVRRRALCVVHRPLTSSSLELLG